MGGIRKDQLMIDRGVIKTERETGRTSVKGIYAGGDAAFGPALFITGIRHGQDAARTIDADLRGTKPYQEFSENSPKSPRCEIKPISHKVCTARRCNPSMHYSK